MSACTTRFTARDRRSCCCTAPAATMPPGGSRSRGSRATTRSSRSTCAASATPTRWTSTTRVSSRATFWPCSTPPRSNAPCSSASRSARRRRSRSRSRTRTARRAWCSPTRSAASTTRSSSQLVRADRAEAEKLPVLDRLLTARFRQDDPAKTFLFRQMGTFNAAKMADLRNLTAGGPTLDEVVAQRRADLLPGRRERCGPAPRDGPARARAAARLRRWSSSPAPRTRCTGRSRRCSTTPSRRFLHSVYA